MKFMVRRTSVFSEENSPCEEAYRDTYTYIDERTASDPTHIPAHRGEGPEWWYEKGENHRVENGRIKRDFQREGWFVDFDSLDELMAFVGKYGEVVLSMPNSTGTIPQIEIYDDYRE